MKKKLIAIIVTAVILGVLIPILILNSKSPEERLIAEACVTVEDAYGEQQEWLRPGQQRRITKGGNIIADVAVTLEEVVIQTEEGEYCVSFSTDGGIWKKIIKGIEIRVYLYETTLEEVQERIRDMPLPPLEGLYNGHKWITLTQSEKQQYVQVVLEYDPSLNTGEIKSINELVTMLNTFYSDSTNREKSILGALEKLLLNE